MTNVGTHAVPHSSGRSRAAQYVRMSTEHQKYSTENQADVITRYAAERGIEIIRTYADRGKSGLSMDGRAGLQQLIRDVQGGRADFSCILVYDVSRWGRFQDADESAYYEYICKDAGISVKYCAEQFENDGSIGATILKSIKRAMAGEFSRELSAKVFAGQSRLVTLGFRQGGAAGYGLRRQLVDEHGQPKAILEHGQAKFIHTDRVILVPGPPNEVDVVRRIYRLFVEEGRTRTAIARALRNDPLARTTRSWTWHMVHRVLTNERYIGNNVYNRESLKLKGKRIVNPPEMWIRKNGAFEPIIAAQLFASAQKVLQDRPRPLTDAEMIDRLRALRREAGTLSKVLIDRGRNLPSAGSYCRRFGNLLRAYELAGYAYGRDYRFVDINRHLRSTRIDIVADAIAAIDRAGGVVRSNDATGLLTINEQWTLSIQVACSHSLGGGRHPLHRAWKIERNMAKPDITILIRLDGEGVRPIDCYVLPHLEQRDLPLRLRAENGVALDTYRFPSVDIFARMTACRSVMDVSRNLGGASKKAAPKAKGGVRRRRLSPRPVMPDRKWNKYPRTARIIEEYRKEALKHTRLVEKSALAAADLEKADNALRQVFADGHFVTLLRAEGLHSVPAPIADRLCQ